jgi:spermidine/putrescine transport system permease protein
MRPRASAWVFNAYLGLFFAYLFIPLMIMSAATFNTSRFPTITPWLGTTLQWFVALWNDDGMWRSLANSLIVAAGVLVVSIPAGLCAAIVLSNLHSRARSLIYAVMVSPLLTPGIIIGISTLIFWAHFGVPAGLPLVIIAQSSFIISYVMLLLLARLAQFDRSLEEAALDLGASHWQVMQRIVLPWLRPALIASALLSFLQSFENYNTTLFTRGLDNTLTVYIASRVRSGLTPAVNALALIMISLTLIGAIVYEVLRRREERAAEALRRTATAQESREIAQAAGAARAHVVGIAVLAREPT